MFRDTIAKFNRSIWQYRSDIAHEGDCQMCKRFGEFALKNIFFPTFLRVLVAPILMKQKGFLDVTTVSVSLFYCQSLRNCLVQTQINIKQVFFFLTRLQCEQIL